MGRVIRCLAIDIRSRRYGYAVFEGSMRLVDWGLREVSYRRHGALKRSLDLIAARYPLDLLVVKRRRDLRDPRAVAAVDALTEHVLESDIGVRRVSKEDVQKTFRAGEPFTNYELALGISRVFTELSDRLPPRPKPWRRQDERYALFHAVAIGMTALWEEERSLLNQ